MRFTNPIAAALLFLLLAPLPSALAQQPPAQESHFNRGNDLYAQGDVDGAIAEWRTAIREQPDNPDAHENIGVALRAKGDLDGAIAEFRMAIRQLPDDPFGHFDLGTALSAKGDLDGAIAEFRTALRLQPNYPAAQSALDKALETKAKTAKPADNSLHRQQDAVPPAAVLPLAAPDLISKGIAAANGQNYLQAIQYFGDARKIAGNTPELLFNLGLAESKIPGRELRAICWFAAYLAAAPAAANAADVRREMYSLDATAKSNLSRLGASVQDVAEKMANRSAAASGLDLQTDQAFKMDDVAGLWLKIGDTSRAVQVGARLDDTDKSDVALDLAEAGKSAEAKSLLAGMKCDPPARTAVSEVDQIERVEISMRNQNIVSAAVKVAQHGEPDLAREILQPCAATGQDTIEAWTAIARAQFKKGDASGAHVSLARALGHPNRLDDGDNDQFVGVACAQAATGDFADADKTVELIKKYKYKGVEDGKERVGFAVSDAERCVARNHLSQGDIAGALAAIARIPPPPPGEDDNLTASIQLAIAMAQLKRGDKDAALQTRANIRSSDYRVAGRDDFDSYLKDPNFFSKSIETTAEERIKPWMDHLENLNHPFFLDLPGYLRSLQSSNVDDAFGGLNNAASEMADEQASVERDMAKIGEQLR